MPCATSAHRRCAYGEQGWVDPESSLYNSLRRNIRRFERDSEPLSLIIRNDILSFRIRCNHPDRRNDVGGAFMPEAYYFSFFNSSPIESTYIVDNGECAQVGNEIKNSVSETTRKQKVLDTLDSLPHANKKKIIAFFCHGWNTGFQFGFKLHTQITYNGTRMPDVEALAAAIIRIAAPDIKIVLYACLTGTTDTGFAAQLRDALVTRCPDCRVDAHKTAGHATKNPHVNRFEGPAGAPGQMIVSPDHRLWNKWRRTLSDPFESRSPLVWKFSQMTIDEIHQYLDSI